MTFYDLLDDEEEEEDEEDDAESAASDHEIDGNCDDGAGGDDDGNHDDGDDDDVGGGHGMSLDASDVHPPRCVSLVVSLVARICAMRATQPPRSTGSGNASLDDSRMSMGD